MPVLDPQHDFAHPVEGDRDWSESYYFNGYDPDADAGLFTRLAVRPNEGTMDVGMSVWLPGQRLAFVHGIREQHTMVDDDLAVAGVRYKRLEPLRRWRLTASGDAQVRDLADPATAPTSGRLELELLFESVMPAVGVDGQRRGPSSAASSEAGGATGKGHFEQAGTWSGTIRWKGETHTLDPARARGNRDKSWGPRTWGGPTMWRWFSINIPGSAATAPGGSGGAGGETHFGGIRLGTGAGDLHRGWVWRDGRAVSIRHWEVQTETAADGVTQRRVRLRITDKEDRAHDLDGAVLRVAAVPYERDGRRTLINEGLTRWTYEGRQGSGIAEYLHQLDAAGRPQVDVE
jgi:hypothetical protein